MGRKERSDTDGWEPRYGNDSRPWLLGFSECEPSVTISTTKETFTGQWPPTPNKEGVRKQMLRKELWEQAERAIVEEQCMDEEAQPSRTTYKETFVKEGFTAKPIKTNDELHRKYPLYLDQAVSLWQEKFPNLPGATRAAHVQHQFRRYAGFTKPIDLLLDDPIDPL